MIVSSCRSTCTGLLWAVIKILIGLTAMAFAPAYADTITLNFTMAMVWQYNLGTSTFDSIQPLTMDVQAVIDDQVTGTIVFSPDTIRTNFGAAGSIRRYRASSTWDTMYPRSHIRRAA